MMNRIKKGNEPALYALFLLIKQAVAAAIEVVYAASYQTLLVVRS
jgi:hypothetical protein